MADSPTYITRVLCIVNDPPDYQGTIDVYVHVSSPDFPIAEGWYYKQCPTDNYLVKWLEENLGSYLHWERRSPPE